MLRRINLLRSIPVAVALAIFSLNPAYAQTAPVVKAQIIRDFARISFEWPREVRIKAGTTGKSLQVTFEQPATVNAATGLGE